MIRVGFLLNVSSDWMGGYNYMKNLLYAINSLNGKKIEPIIFFSSSSYCKLKAEFDILAQVVEAPFMNKNSFQWFLWKISRKITKSDFMVEFFLRKFDIDVFSHSLLIGLKNSKTVNWIPDFQHLYLPEMFSHHEIKLRNKIFNIISEKSDVILLSSYESLKDFNNLCKKNSFKGQVLQFVSQPGPYKEDSYEDFLRLRDKYKINTDFFIIPNQFWKHKNHMIVFKALTILKMKGYNLTLICTGKVDAYKNKEYSNQIRQFIFQNQIDIRLLDIIDYHEMITLMKYSIAVINPSLFEGWSSTVEECKSLGKNIILSNIAVHKEQNPAKVIYFDPYNSEEISSILEKFITGEIRSEKIYDLDIYNENLKLRTYDFAIKYEAIIESLFSPAN